MRLLILSIVTLLDLSAHAAAAALPTAKVRYGELPMKAVRTPLVTKVEEAVKRRAVELGHGPLESDARLEAAAEDIARAVPLDVQPPNDVVQEALWLHGIIEPPPHLIVVAMSPAAEDTLIGELQKQLPSAFQQGRFRRIGVGAAPAGGETQLVIALEESMIAIDPIPRELPLGARVTVRGHLLGTLTRPELFITAPDGHVQSIPIASDREFSATYTCEKSGRHQLEITGTDRFGPTVVANFPLYCGVPAPSKIESSSRGSPVADTFIDAAHAEKQMLLLVNEDRGRANLPPLSLDDSLSKVARAHSGDMQDHGFVGHVSPTTGNASDRVHRAGSPNADAQLILENVARAYSVKEAERGLMDSPGHRQNLLNREVTMIGIGIVAAPLVGGAPPSPRELLVTQLFMRPSERFHPQRTPLLMRDGIDRLRSSKNLKPLVFDAKLDALASDAAQKIAAGKLTTQGASAALDGPLTTFGGKYRSVRTLLAISSSSAQVVSSLAEALSDPYASALGVGVAEGVRPSGNPKSDSGHALYVVLLLAQERNPQ